MLSKQQAKLLKRISEFFNIDLKLILQRLEWVEGKVYEELPQQIKRSRQLILFDRKDSAIQDQTYELEEDIEQLKRSLEELEEKVFSIQKHIEVLRSG